MKVGDIVYQLVDHDWIYHEGLLDPEHTPSPSYDGYKRDNFPKGTLFRVAKYNGSPYNSTLYTLTGPPRTLYGMPMQKDYYKVL